MSGKAFRIFVDDQIFYHPNMSRLAITKAVIDEDAENIDSFTLGVPHNHPYIDMIQPMSSVIVCKKGDTVVFQGRAIDAGTDFYNTHTWTCESCLAYLKDTQQEPYEYNGTLSGLLEYFIGVHNSMVEAKKQFVVGNVTVTDSNDYVSYSNSDYSTTMEAISDKLIGNYGGYLQVRYEDDLLYLDYLADFNSYSLQTVEFGKNLLDVTITYDHTERYSALIPRGAAITETDDDGNEVETGEYVDITSVNDGVNYVYDSDTVEEIGWIWTVYEWSDVTLASNLLTKARAKLAELTAGVTSMELKIIDESDTDADIGDIRARQYVYCYSEPHGIDGTYLVLSRSRDYLNPSGNTITIGAEGVTLTGTTTKNASSLQAQLSEIATSVKLSSSAILSVDVEYYASSSQTELADGEWSTEAPSWESGTYIWTRTKTTTVGGTVSYSDAVCITGADGEDGEDGADGLGITDITEQYYLSTSDEECVDGEWSETCPDWADGYYIWTRSHITWSDGSETDTTPVLAQALNNLYTTTQTLTEEYSSLEQSLTEITAVVGSWTETYGVDEDGNLITTIAEAVSALQQTAESISLTLESNTWLTTEDAAELYATKSELTATAESIQLSVSSNTESIETLSSLIMTSDEIRLQTTALSWESTYSSMTEDGTLTCVNAVITNATIDSVTITNASVSGSVTTTNGLYTTILDGGQLEVWYDSILYGKISSAYWVSDSTCRGVAMAATSNSTFIMLGMAMDDEEDYDAAYIINYGLNPGDISTAHIFYGSAYFSSTLTVSSSVYLSNGKYLYWYNASGTADSFLYLSNTDLFYVGSTSYYTYVQGSRLYLGSTSYPTYLYGSSITVSGAITFGSSVYFSNAKYIYWYNSSSTAYSFIYLNSSNNFYVGSTSYYTYVRGSYLYLGSTSYPTYLRGSSITVTGAITFSGAVTCSSTLAVTSTSTFSSMVTISSSLEVTGHSYVYNGLFVEGGLNVDGIFIDNAEIIYWYNASSSYVSLLYFDSSNYFYVGSTSYRTYIQGSYVYLSKYLYLSNGYGIYSANSSGSYYRILYMSSSNVVYVGSTSYQTTIYGSSIYVGTSATTSNIYIGYNSAIPYIYIGYSSSQYVRLSGTVTVNGTSVSSDLRLKTNIETLDNLYLKVLDGLRPAAYSFRDAPEKRHAGFIAQEVLEILTEIGAENILVGDDGEGYYTLDYNALIPILVAGYQNLKRRIDLLEGSTHDK